VSLLGPSAPSTSRVLVGGRPPAWVGRGAPGAAVSPRRGYSRSWAADELALCRCRGQRAPFKSLDRAEKSNCCC